MNKTAQDTSDPQLNIVFIGLAVCWSLAIVAIAAWGYWQTYIETVNVARTSASESYKKDLVYLRWANMHGGFYVLVTPETPPNTYLSTIPERDVRTPSGRTLTWIHPAYMARQIHELEEQDFGTKGHLTSLKSLRPENAPDEWEKRALQAFEQGEKEVSSIEPLGSETYLRLMRPLSTEEECLACHAKQGYKIGDIRGGLSVSIPWAPYREALRSQQLVNIFGYGVIWAVGMLGLGVGKKRIQNHLSENKLAETALRESEQRYRTLFSHAMDGILLLDAKGDIVNVNDSFARMHGYSVDELLNMNLRELDTLETLAGTPDRLVRILAGESIGFEVEHIHKDGHIVPLDVAASAIDIDGKLHILAFHRDITERRRAEQEIKRTQQELRGMSNAANKALEDERRRTARELHDELGQSLTALKMDLESLNSDLPPGQPNLMKRVQAMHTLLSSTVAATRRIAANLRPLMLDDLGLAAALDWLTHNFSNHSGIATDLFIDDSVAKLPEPITSALYRITQESLTNVAKYAQATSVEIRLERDGEWVQLTIRDNGRGIEEAEKYKQGRFGLLGIRERVMLLSGKVAIKGEPGRGSEVRVRIPLAAVETPGTPT